MSTPVKRARPYAQFNFLVDLGTGETASVDAGFQECSNLGMEVAVAEYRAGNFKDNGVMKLTMLNKSSDVTLKRGVMGSSTLYDWLNDIRNGNEGSLRTVRVSLMSEDHQAVVAVWSMLNARIIKYTSGPFNAKTSDVAMEDLTLAFERLEAEFPG
jgi:phage tail-like protein